MKLPAFVESFVREVWDECDPAKVTSDAHYRKEFGVPPTRLMIGESTSANWEMARCLPPLVRAWGFDGTVFAEVPCDQIPEPKRRGMYWDTGSVAFAIDRSTKRVVYDYSLGPRYARGFQKSFESLDTLTLDLDRRHLRWVS